MVTCDEDDDDEEDILAEIGSENEDEEYEEHGEGDEILYLDDHGITINVTTRSGRNAIRFLLYKFKVSVIQFGPCCNTRSLSVGGGGWGGGVHDKLCKPFWRVNIFSAPGMGRVSPKLVG